MNDQVNSQKTIVAKSLQYPFWEVVCIPPLIFVHRFSYNLIGELLAVKDTNNWESLTCAWDLSIPYIPLFILPYLFAWVYPLFILLYCIICGTYHHQTFRYFYLSILVLTGIECLIWYNFPASIMIRVPSEVLAEHGMLGSLTAYVYQHATPWNVFPSAHIATAYLFWLLSKHFALSKQRWLFLLTFILITLSVVFIKNHYIADIIGGIVLAHLVYQGVFLPAFKRKLLHRISTLNIIAFNCFIFFFVASFYRIVVE